MGKKGASPKKNHLKTPQIKHSDAKKFAGRLEDEEREEMNTVANVNEQLASELTHPEDEDTVDAVEMNVQPGMEQKKVGDDESLGTTVLAKNENSQTGNNNIEDFPALRTINHGAKLIARRGVLISQDGSENTNVQLSTGGARTIAADGNLCENVVGEGLNKNGVREINAPVSYASKVIGKPRVVLSAKAENTVVDYFLGDSPYFGAVRDELFRNWRKEGLMRIDSNEREFVFLQFKDLESRDKLLDVGPMHVAGRLLVTQKWHPMMSLAKSDLRKIPLWVKLYNIPFELWNIKNLCKIASGIGIPLYTDKATENKLRMSYARICIEVDAEKALPNVVKIRNEVGKEVDVEVFYQWKPLRCDKCKVFGHSEKKCPTTILEDKVRGNRNNEKGNNPNKKEDWQDVGNRKNQKPKHEYYKRPIVKEQVKATNT